MKAVALDELDDHIEFTLGEEKFFLEIGEAQDSLQRIYRECEADKSIIPDEVIMWIENTTGVKVRRTHVYAIVESVNAAWEAYKKNCESMLKSHFGTAVASTRSDSPRP